MVKTQEETRKIEQENRKKEKKLKEVSDMNIALAYLEEAEKRVQAGLSFHFYISFID